ncbi:hypothetical protein [Agrobacterium tumefaciens]
MRKVTLAIKAFIIVMPEDCGMTPVRVDRASRRRLLGMFFASSLRKWSLTEALEMTVWNATELPQKDRFPFWKEVLC